jgi:hypothetical protein
MTKKLRIWSMETVYYCNEVDVPDNFEFSNENVKELAQTLMDEDDFDYTVVDAGHFELVDDWELA